MTKKNDLHQKITNQRDNHKYTLEKRTLCLLVKGLLFNMWDCLKTKQHKKFLYGNMSVAVCMHVFVCIYVSWSKGWYWNLDDHKGY